jgi:hypothetical protein
MPGGVCFQNSLDSSSEAAEIFWGNRSRFSTFKIPGEHDGASNLLCSVACTLAPDDVHEQNHSGEDYFGKPPHEPANERRTELKSRASNANNEAADER